MKKLLSSLLVLALFLSLSLAGGWGVQAKADTPEDRVGTYELIGMTVEGEDYTEVLKLANITISLVLNADGTAALSTGDEVVKLTWDEKNFTADDGVPVPYTFDNGVLTLKEEDSVMTFQKVDGSTQKIPMGEAGSIVGLWVGSVDMKAFLADAEPDLAKHMDRALMSVVLDMREDGTYTLSLDATTIIPSVQAAMYGYIEEMCEQSGITVAQMEEANGKSLDEIVSDAIADMDLSQLSNTVEGVYEEKDGQVIWDKGANETRGIFTGDTLIFTDDGLGEIVLIRGGIVGLWVATVNLADLAGAGDEELAQFFADANLDLNLELRSDNSAILSVDSSSILPAMKAGMEAYLNAALEEQGMTMEDMEKVYGKSKDEIIDEALSEMDLSELELTAKGTYTEKDGEVALKLEDGDEQTGSWSGNTLAMEVEEFGTLNFIHVSAEDILAKGEGAMTYAEYAAAELDTPVVIEAYVQAHQDWWNDAVTVYAQDAEGGYFIYNMACSEKDAELLVPGQKIRVTGYKSEWSGEIEITEATFEFVRGSFVFKPVDVTALLGKDELIEHQNQLVSFKGMTIEAYDDTGAAFAYKDPDGKTDDLYFKASKDGKTYDFCVEFYLCGKDTEVYKAVEGLNVGDTVDLEGFLYWYNGSNPHITAVTVK